MENDEPVVTGSVAANTTVGDTSMNSGLISNDLNVSNVSNGGFIVNGTVEMDVDNLDGTITVSDDEDMDGSNSDVNSVVENNINNNHDDDDDDGIEVLVVRPKSKSRLLPPLPPDFDLEIISNPEGSQTLSTMNPKTGYVKELIEQNGLGIIFSMESGPVLFSTNHVWADGVKVDVEEAHEYVKTGSNVNFIEHIVESPDFDIISPECILRQAIGVWIGSKPSKFWRLSSNKGHLEELERNRREFVDRIRNADFLSLDLVRSGGKIAGYLSKHIGIISTRDTPSGRPTHVFFHTTDAYVFREAIVLENDEDIFDVLPVGLAVRFDARVTRLNFCKEVTYQACAVFAGAWPAVPHPTLLPGGEGTYAPCYSIPRDHTFYYLQMNLFHNLEEKVDDFRQTCEFSKGSIYSKFMNLGSAINGFDDYMTWKNCYAPFKFLQNNENSSRDRRAPKQNYHVFARRPPTEPVSSSIPFKIKREAKPDEKITVKQELGGDFVIKKER